MGRRDEQLPWGGGCIKVVSKEGRAAKDGLQIKNNCPGSSGSARRVSYSSRNQRCHKQLRATVKMEVGISGLRRSHSRAHKWRSTIISTINKNTYYRGSE